MNLKSLQYIPEHSLMKINYKGVSGPICFTVGYGRQRIDINLPQLQYDIKLRV